jgi:hypothetical protein
LGGEKSARIKGRRRAGWVDEGILEREAGGKVWKGQEGVSSDASSVSADDGSSEAEEEVWVDMMIARVAERAQVRKTNARVGSEMGSSELEERLRWERREMSVGLEDWRGVVSCAEGRKAEAGAVEGLVEAVRTEVVRLTEDAAAEGVVEEDDDVFALTGREVGVILEGVGSAWTFRAVALVAEA